MKKNIWDDELLDEELRRCIDAGMSGGRTALEMGLSNGQVAGRASRLGLRFSSAPGHKRKRSGGVTSGSFKPCIFQPYREAPKMSQEVEPLNLTLEQLKNNFTECRWIMNEDIRNAVYCGIPTEECSYCVSHQKIAYNLKSNAA